MFEMPLSHWKRWKSVPKSLFHFRFGKWPTGFSCTQMKKWCTPLKNCCPAEIDWPGWLAMSLMLTGHWKEPWPEARVRPLFSPDLSLSLPYCLSMCTFCFIVWKHHHRHNLTQNVPFFSPCRYCDKLLTASDRQAQRQVEPPIFVFC